MIQNGDSPLQKRIEAGKFELIASICIGFTVYKLYFHISFDFHGILEKVK